MKRQSKEKRAAYMRRWRRENPEKAHAMDRARYRRNKIQVRALQIRMKFGITHEQFSTILVSQNSRCAICSTDKAGGRGDWHVDHNHETKQVRGLLCHNCNVGLGHFKDDPLRLELAASYLRRYV